MIISQKIQRVVAWLMLFFMITGTTFSPVTARAFSVGEEREVGEHLLSIVRSRFTLLDDPDISQYITGLGQEMLAPLGPQYFDYHFFVVSNRDLNAFAAPSGLIFIHSGLIEAVNKENELVSVLGHEVGHVVQRHIAGRIDKSKKLTAGAVALMIAGIAMGGGPLAEALVVGSAAASTSIGLKFNRMDEEEADRLAFSWMQNVNRDPASMVDMLRELRRITRFRSANIPPYLLTHPDPGARMGYVQDLVLFNPRKDYRKVDEFPFQRIKARILSQTIEPMVLTPRYSKILADPAAGDDEKAFARFGLALVLEREARYDLAESEMLQVISAMPDRAILKTDLGIIYFNSGRLSQAEKLFRETLAVEPKNAYASFNLARTLHQTGSPSEALRIYEDLLPIFPDYVKLYYELGKLKTELKEPATAAYYLGMYHWYSGTSRLEDAKTQFQRAISGLPAGDRLRAKAEEMMAKIVKIEEKS